MRHLSLTLLIFLLTIPAGAESAQELLAKAQETDIPTKRIRFLNKAIAEDKNFALGYFMRAQANTDLGDCAAALPDLNRAAELSTATAQIRYYRASCLMELGKSSAALEDYTAIIEAYPDSASAYYRRGLAYAALERPADALKDFSRALTLDPGYAAKPSRAAGHGSGLYRT